MLGCGGAVRKVWGCGKLLGEVWKSVLEWGEICGKVCWGVGEMWGSIEEGLLGYSMPPFTLPHIFF